MIPEVVLRVDGVSKKYRSYKSNLNRIGGWLGFSVAATSEHFALDSIDLTLQRGDAIALIGQNGAGKSTLLKIITGTVRPTSGSVHIAGRISAILELGLGFNPEFTGRENVMNSGGLIGFSAKQLRDLMPEIEAFAEIGDYFDAPVRTYSSGMQARLAFALATAVRPEILIVDEVLSVGDAYFQHKSFARIREFRDAGSTLILVTHSLADVRELCSRVLLIEKGRIVRDGPPDEVIDYYNAMIAEKENAKLSIEQRRRKDGWLHTEFGDGRVRMDSIELYRPGEEEPVRVVTVGETLEARAVIRVIEDTSELVLGHRITDRTGHTVWGSNTWHTGQALASLRAGETVTSSFVFECDLGPGSYALSYGLHSRDTHLEDCYHKAENQIVFEVVRARGPVFIGTSHLKASFKIGVAQSA